MSRLFRLGIFLLLVSCGGGNRSAPRNLDNACSILDQRPKYLSAMQRAERRWGVPVHVQMATIYQESKFVGNAKTPHKFALGIIPMGRQSSAFGYSQALDGTWEDYQRDTRS
ncbi:MAG: lytic transglycosylase, partial [Albidovulum sp.]